MILDLKRRKKVIDPERVEFMFKDCLYAKEELTGSGFPIDEDSMVEVKGILNSFGLNKHRVESHREEVTNCLDQLPDEFKKSGGGGWTFLNACNTKDGEQWTGLHQVMEQLVCLGIALGLVSYTLPREMWQIFPGDMPYIVVDLDGGEDERKT